MTSLLELRSVRKGFAGVPVLHGVDLRIDQGEVLALLGENGAGKSTLVKIIAGDHTADDGDVLVDGEPVRQHDPFQARALGIRMIFQELNDAGPLTVAENISLGRWSARRGLVSWSSMRKRAEAVLAQLGAGFDVSRTVESLRIGERQLVEIARALSDEARILILDEPTAALSSSEVDQLFRAMGQMRSRGVAMIYITHRLDEVTAIADRVQVLRDGVGVLDAPVRELSRAQMVTAMIGREADGVTRPKAPQGVGSSVLEVGGLCSGSLFEDVDLDVGAGEIVALYGKIGSGTAEVVEAAFGLHPITGGTMRLDGADYRPDGPASAVNQGLGFLPADRKQSGLFAIRPVAENLAAPSWPRMSRGGFLGRASERAAWSRWREALSIRSRNEPGQPIATLSGGNQQKVLLARWFERGSRVLLLVEPTRGVDVGARSDIYRTLRRFAENESLAVLVSTSDYEEVIQLADRVLVMVRGRVVDHLTGAAVTSAALTSASASGGDVA